MRLSVPSYVVPGTWLENLRWLEANTDQRSVELLFFLYDGETREILARELPAIRGYADSFRYSVHLPDRLLAEHEELVGSLSPWADSFVVHPPRESDSLGDFCALMDALRSSYGAERFFLENTRMDLFERADDALSASRFGRPPLCADAGHLLLQGIEPEPWIRERAARVRELHLHGLAGGRDHRALSGTEGWLASLRPFLAGFSGIAQLEIFSWEDLLPALRSLSRLRDEATG